MTREEIIARANRSVTDAFGAGAELEHKRLVEKACEYLRTHLWQSVDDDNDTIVESIQNTTLDNFIKDFKRYLEE